MKDYLFLFRGGLDFTKAPQERVQQVIIKWKSWVEKLTAEGIYNGGERLTKNGAAVVRGNARQLTNGPCAHDNEIVGGFISIKADSLEQRSKFAKTAQFSILMALLK